MAISTDYNYQFVLKLIKKNQAGSVSASEFNFHWNDASYSYHGDLLGRFQLRANGKTGMNTGLMENETIMTKLTPFIIPITIPIVAGQATKPSDFIYTLALRISNKQVFQVNPDQVWSIFDDVIDPPSEVNGCYYYTEYQNYYKLFPSTVTSLDLDYIKSPILIVWGYTFDGQGRQVYDPGTSVQPEWDDSSCMEITKRMLKNLGIYFKDSDFENFGQSVITTGE